MFLIRERDRSGAACCATMMADILNYNDNIHSIPQKEKFQEDIGARIRREARERQADLRRARTSRITSSL